MRYIFFLLYYSCSCQAQQIDYYANHKKVEHWTIWVGMNSQMYSGNTLSENTKSVSELRTQVSVNYQFKINKILSINPQITIADNYLGAKTTDYINHFDLLIYHDISALVALPLTVNYKRWSIGVGPYIESPVIMKLDYMFGAATSRRSSTALVDRFDLGIYPFGGVCGSIAADLGRFQVRGQINRRTPRKGSSGYFDSLPPSTVFAIAVGYRL